MMNIIPVSSVPFISSISGTGNTIPVGGGSNLTETGRTTSGSTFSDFFKDAVSQIEELDAIKTQDSYALAVGDADNLAEIAINAQKYDLAVQLMVEMRNKLLDSYSEIMRMNV